MSTRILVIGLAIAHLSATASEFTARDDFDLRLHGGIASAVSEVHARGLVIDQPGETTDVHLGTTSTTGPHVGIELAWTRMWPSGFGFTQGFALSYDAHLGAIKRVVGTNDLAPGDGRVEVKSVTFTYRPALAMRADSWADPELAPDALQIEIGPFLGIGAARTRIGGAANGQTQSLISYGALATMVWTFESRWQMLVEGGYETADTGLKPRGGGDGAVLLDGPVVRLGLGYRF